MQRNEIDQDPWAKALHDCTACLRERKPECTDLALAYLEILEKLLAVENITVGITGNGAEDRDDYQEDKVPGHYPLEWDSFVSVNTDAQDFNTYLAKESSQQTTSIGDSNNSRRLSGQRVLTRIFTSQSELYAAKATHIAKSSGDWTTATQAYEAAIHKIHEALEVTDTAISKWWNRWEKGLELIVSERELLTADASIVVVTLESLISRRDRLLTMGRREESRLLRKLQPQWQSRDAAKERMGTDRWKNNPKPKYEYAKLREDLETELRCVQEAMDSLQELDPKQALQKASGLKEQLLSGNKRREPKDSEATGNEKIHRYNKQRPSSEWMALRVPLEDYPDPVDFGWTFTGSWEAVEFFERMVTPETRSNPNHKNNNQKRKSPKPKLVKLDWYFTTGTIKTSLDHPVQGKTQLFAKQCSPSLYAKVLTNPRTHTGKRYQRKPRQVPHHAPQKQQLSH